VPQYDCFTLLFCCSEFHIIVLKVEQATRDRQSKQDKYAKIKRRKDKESEAKECMLVSDIYIVWIKRSLLL
jgi:hypothetical protein